MATLTQRIKFSIDPWLVNVVLVLVAAGVVLVYDTSYVLALKTGHNGSQLFQKQLWLSVTGIGIMWCASKVPYKKLAKWSPWLLCMGVLMLLAVWIPGCFPSDDPAHQWIGRGWARIQPSEFAKLAIILYLAANIARNLDQKGFDIRIFKDGLLPAAGVLAVVCLLIEREPDLGTAMVIGLTGLSIFYLAGARRRHIGVLVLAGLAFVLIAMSMRGFSDDRLTAFLNPSAHKDKIGYQLWQSLLGIGSGKLTGVGLGDGLAKFFLPEANSDFAFTTLSEEFGLVGGVALLGLMLTLAWRTRNIALKSSDTFGQLAASGIGAMVALQALLNVAVVTCTIPTTGIPLPFISYGGSSTIMLLASMGVLLNISYHANRSPVQR